MRLLTTAKLASALIAMAILVGGNFASAATPQPISLTLTGGVLRATHQAYDVSGGALVSLLIGGMPVSTTGFTLRYSYHATVEGTKVHGQASFEVDSSGGQQVVVGQADIIDSVSVHLPFGCTGSACDSVIPILFSGKAHITIQSGSVSIKENVQAFFESPYWNPFGGPILLFTGDGALKIIASYTQGTINWSKAIDGGMVVGAIGTPDPVSGSCTPPSCTPVSGLFSQRAAASENLVTGIESDQGTITFFGMSPSFLNSRGDYSGLSFIPTTTSNPPPFNTAPFNTSPFTPATCDSSIPLPATCSSTSLISTGTFSTATPNVSINGAYLSLWSNPALGFESFVTGTVVQSS